ncbi:enoyl-CoA hydratase/isomerase family protein [Bacterioplanoides sp.]|uniref:enoyl-CoA hydratase/isomerase family protein n=1 Tax=Bacterioplanoides sp. TaxID=2066072 RepID=UPI003AFFCB50
MAYQLLTFSLDQGIARITLNRPKEGNTFNQALADELDDVVRECMMNSQARVVVLSGNGKLFSGGGDLAYMQANADHLDVAIKKLADRLHSAYSALSRMSVPVIVSVQGTAAGIGLSLALLGDLTIASDKAYFAAAYTGVGLNPDGGLTYFLPRAIGVKRAQEFILLNQTIKAEKALEWGMVNQVVAAEELDNTVDALAKKLSEGSQASFAAVKQLMSRSFDESLESQLHHEGMLLARNAMSENGKEGIQAFIDGRKPEFKHD